MRSCHYIKPNARSETPRRAFWIALDLIPLRRDGKITEWTFQTGTLLAGIKSGRTGQWNTKQYTLNNWMRFFQLVNALTKSKMKTYILCTNSNSTLTLLNVLSHGLIYGWRAGLMVLACPPCIVSMRKGNRAIAILDIQNIWPTRLPDTWNGANTKDSAAYPENSVPLPGEQPSAAVCRSMMRKTVEWWNFLKTNDLGGFSTTVGAQSKRVWRHRFMTHKVLIDCHDDALALARKALYGGRCEAYKIGSFTGDFYMLDTNGSYGSVMADLDVPVRLLAYTENATVAELEEWSKTYELVALVQLTAHEANVPFRDSGTLRFCTGRIQTALCGAELREQLRVRSISNVLSCAVYERQPAFSRYMQELWRMRLDAHSRGNISDAEGFKSLTVSFAGKWAQKGGYWENVGSTNDLSIQTWYECDYPTKVVTEYRQVAGRIQRRNQETESYESHPAIAACINAAARMKLYGYIREAGLDTCYYVDTDALLVNSVGFGRLHHHIRAGELGALKIEWVAKSIQIYGPKGYDHDGTRRFSGLRKGGVFDPSGAVLQSQSVKIEAQIWNEHQLGTRTLDVSKRFKVTDRPRVD